MRVIGMADTGKPANASAGVIYDNCYQEGEHVIIIFYAPGGA